jgi:cytochrome c-type biogenesis protein CcmH/NrfG
VRRITEGRSGGFLTLTIEWTDPKLAAKWATELVSFANDFLRREALATAQQNIAFLEKQLQTTNIVEIRMSLNRLLEEQLNRLMLAKGEAEYAFKTIDPAIVPSGKANMPGNRIVLIWTIAGILLACIVAVAEAVLWRVSPPGIKGG